MKALFKFAILVFSFAFSTAMAKEKVVYKYKKFEKFDFGELSVGGGKGPYGDLSVTLRKNKKFKNKLPYRKNFNPELLRALDRVY